MSSGIRGFFVSRICKSRALTRGRFGAAPENPSRVFSKVRGVSALACQGSPAVRPHGGAPRRRPALRGRLRSRLNARPSAVAPLALWRDKPVACAPVFGAHLRRFKLTAQDRSRPAARSAATASHLPLACGGCGGWFQVAADSRAKKRLPQTCGSLSCFVVSGSAALTHFFDDRHQRHEQRDDDAADDDRQPDDHQRLD